jgi:hypothetical protein
MRTEVQLESVLVNKDTQSDKSVLYIKSSPPVIHNMYQNFKKIVYPKEKQNKGRLKSLPKTEQIIHDISRNDMCSEYSNIPAYQFPILEMSTISNTNSYHTKRFSINRRPSMLCQPLIIIALEVIRLLRELYAQLKGK